MSETENTMSLRSLDDLLEVLFLVGLGWLTGACLAFWGGGYGKSEVIRIQSEYHGLATIVLLGLLIGAPILKRRRQSTVAEKTKQERLAWQEARDHWNRKEAAMTARLTRIWAIEGAELQREDVFRESRWWASLSPDVEFEMFTSLSLGHPMISLSLRCPSRATTLGALFYGKEEHRVTISQMDFADTENQRDFSAFVDKWLPFFRRGCWLSGVDIEASTHEKEEWIQGFSREELDEWNLKV